MIFVAWTNQVIAAEFTAEKPVILVYGDSLSAGYGLAQQQAWVRLLEKKIDSEHYSYAVMNASISGETTSGGLSRFSAALNNYKPAIIILELGANDGLRGLPVNAMANNLKSMLEQAKKNHAKVLLLGMRIPPNYGPRYTQAFSDAYIQLSKEFQIPLVPFMLDNVAGKSQLIQDDGLHPNALGQPIILDNIWPQLKPLLTKMAARESKTRQ